MGLPILYIKGSQIEFSKYDVFLFLEIYFILANSADPNEMPPYVAFHLRLHCMPRCPFRVSSIQIN